MTTNRLFAGSGDTMNCRPPSCLLYTSGWDLGFLADDRVAVIECNWRQGLLAQVPQGRGYYHELKKLCQKP